MNFDDLVLGIDGGGTKTVAWLSTVAGAAARRLFDFGEHLVPRAARQDSAANDDPVAIGGQAQLRSDLSRDLFDVPQIE